jgi:mono/diheme cytochrome c family protein
MRLQMLFGVTILTLVGVHAGLSLAGAPPDARTQRVWRAKCAGCHGDDGKGQTEQGKKLELSDMTNADWQKKYTDVLIRGAVANGIKETRNGKLKEMEAFKDLRPDQVDGLIAMIRSFAK